MKIEFSKNKALLRFYSSLYNARIEVGVEGEESASRAVVHEFGDDDKRVPARPFLRPAVLNEKNINEGLRQAVRNRNVETLGAWLAGKAREYIWNMVPGITWEGNVIKPLSAKTIRKKGSSKLLRDKGTMWQSIRHNVVK